MEEALQSPLQAALEPSVLLEEDVSVPSTLHGTGPLPVGGSMHTLFLPPVMNCLKKITMPRVTQLPCFLQGDAWGFPLCGAHRLTLSFQAPSPIHMRCQCHPGHSLFLI